jgi:hypothetical protein
MWTATDADGNDVSDAQLVTVVDTTPPTLSPPGDVTDAECTGPDGTPVELDTAEAEDICDPSPDVTHNSPGVFPLGDTTVTWTATDDDGNDVSADQLVTVVDTTPPDILCNAPGTINPTDAGDDKADPKTPVAFTATAEDICDSEVPALITEFGCYAVKKNGKHIDKTESCKVTFSGDRVTILDTGGVGTHIWWTVTAEDDTGNTREEGCKVEVINPTL